MLLTVCAGKYQQSEMMLYIPISWDDVAYMVRAYPECQQTACCILCLLRARPFHSCPRIPPSTPVKVQASFLCPHGSLSVVVPSQCLLGQTIQPGRHAHVAV